MNKYWKLKKVQSRVAGTKVLTVRWEETHTPIKYMQKKKDAVNRIREKENETGWGKEKKEV